MSKIINLEMAAAEVPSNIEKISTSRKWVYWGEKNRWPYDLYQIYKNSAILQSVVNSVADYVVGDGIEMNPEILTKLPKLNADGDTVTDLIRRCVTDYVLFGGCALQVINNKAGELNEIYWLDMRKLRMNEDRDMFYYADWNKLGRNKMIELPKYKKGESEKTGIFLITNKLEREVYPVPSWEGALKSAMTDAEISNFHLNSIINNFVGSTIINFNNGVADPEVREDIEKKLNDKFSGSGNAGKLLVSFNESPEQATTVSRLEEDHFDEKYQALSESVRQNILTAFRINPILVGVNVETGFSKQEFVEAFKLVNKTVITPIQNAMEGAFSSLFGVNNALTFKEFKIYDDEI